MNRRRSGPSRPRRIDWRQPFTQTLDHSRPPFARWFCGGTTNLCHNAVDRWLDKQPEALALIAVSSETDEERTFTFSQLHDEVNAVARHAAVAGRAAWRSRIGLYADDCRSADNPAGLRAHWRDPFGGLWRFCLAQRGGAH
ncbi:propionate--CoA ligase [Salmonella enterica subsp. enterica]|uniref:Propionate--CoA ligase n=1 Tax=Salmonella enterica I TaxID=59201 RepID=A0A379WYX8_SALET|nr:propionate--CoA ligase [Salmonella enterica subsp. enterica]